MTLASFQGRFERMEVGPLIPMGLEGVGVESSRVPPRWVQDGDEFTIEIERIGALTDQVRAAARNGGTR